jgi:hypothetical protein
MDHDPVSPGHSNPNDEAFRALALRLLGQFKTVLPPMSEEDRHARLIAGQVAAEFPSEVPFPAGIVIAGSLITARVVMVICDSDLPLKRLADFYERRLPVAGWSPFPAHGASSSGFTDTSAGPPRLGLTFCRGDESRSLQIIATERDGGATDVRLSLIHHGRPDRSPCSQQAEPPPIGRPDRLRLERVDRMIPVLRTPPGAQQPGGRVGGTGTDGGTLSDHDFTMNMSATLTDAWLDPAAVGQHYHDQLVHAGWTPTSVGAMPRAAWSTWTFTDEDGEPWSAVLLAIQLLPTAGRYLMTLRAERTTPDASVS